jgi:hypothetical protein
VTTLEKLRDRSPISSPAAEGETVPRILPCRSIAASASSRSRRMRAVKRDAYRVSATDPMSSAASTILNRRSNARLRSASTALVVSSTITAPLT